MADEAPEATPYRMVGVRAVLSTGAVRLEQQVVAIESAVNSNPSLVFDVSKTLIESACKTILNDRAEAVDEKWDLPRLLKEATSKLQLSPSGTESSDEPLRKLIGGLQ